ncbi:MAG: NAD(P)H-dependent oxidoreductase [Devosia sp.]
MDATTVLAVNASGRTDGSHSRALTARIIEKLQERGNVARLIDRDLAAGIEFVDGDWIAANFTPDAERTAGQAARLAASDALVDELLAADVVVIGAPIYNFGVPAVLKAWIDQVARARKTFRYTEDGPEGLLTGKKAYVVVTSGGTEADGAIDFATPYLRHVLGFVGITDVTVIKADRLMFGGEERVVAAHRAIDDAFARPAVAHQGKAA